MKFQKWKSGWKKVQRKRTASFFSYCLISAVPSKAIKMDILSEIKRVLQLEGEAILECANRLEGEIAAEQLKKALYYLAGALEKGGKIIITGVGKSGKVAQKIAATLSSTGSLAIFLHPTEGLHGDLGIVQVRDVVLALSHTGNTEEIIKLLPSLKARGIPIIGLGGNRNSQLAAVCSAWIDASIEIEACPHNLAPTTSTTVALALGDAVAMALMQMRGFDAQSFAENHPGGSLGRRMNLRVQDLMVQGEALPLLGPEMPMEEVVNVSSRKKLGAVMVTEGRQLLGIITDGDIRRALKLKERFFDLKAKEVMTVNPVTVKPMVMAQEALELMENRPSQISVLPVVDELGYCLGLIRLHDLVRVF
jgi:arabinose-5-phosphate isomerase